MIVRENKKEESVEIDISLGRRHCRGQRKKEVKGETEMERLKER